MIRSPLRQDARRAGRTLSSERRRGNARQAATPLMALVLATWWSGPSHAIEIVAIEEHWELTVGEPDPGSSGPQVCMVMSPTADLNSDYFVFTLNHRSAPKYVPGGMQVQQWCGVDVVDSRVGPQESALHDTNEVVRWVQRTEIKGGALVFEVLTGQSSSWGVFGGQEQLRFSIATHLSTLNGYRPAISLKESGVSFARNRVKSLILTKLRWYDSAGMAHELNAPIDVNTVLNP